MYSHAALAWRAVSAHLNGQFEEAERIARESLRIAEAAGAPEARAFFLTQLFAVRREQGRLAELVDPLERLSRLPGPVGVSWRSTLPFILVEAGEPARARVAYEAVAADDFAALPISLFRLTGLICLAEACAALGDAAGADVAVTRGSSRTPTGSCRPASAAAGARSGASSACSPPPPAAPDEARAQLEAALEPGTSSSTPRASSPARAATSASCCWPRASASTVSRCSPRRAPRPPSSAWPASPREPMYQGPRLGAL